MDIATKRKPGRPSSTLIEFDHEAIAKYEASVALESDEDITERLRERFAILKQMTQAVRAGQIRAMIISGPPGVGKSFGVEDVLERDDLFSKLTSTKPKFQVIKGYSSPLGLYCKLHEFSEKGNVLVFDDSDSLFFDPICLGLLKGALDSSLKRTISWNTDSRVLKEEGIPSRFDFNASVIFITNINFQHVRSKNLKSHLDALESRCHYIDLGMNTQREKVLRMRQIVLDGMLDKYDFEEAERDEVVDFVFENQDKMRELSLRTILKISDLKKSFPDNYQAMARMTVMRQA